jgi:hypothetical protein
LFVLVMVALALPLLLGLLVAIWLGVVLLAVYAVAAAVWLGRPANHVHEFRHGLVARTRTEVTALRWDDAVCVYQAVSQIVVNGGYVRFDDVTINPRGITFPEGTVSWQQLRELAVGSGTVWLHTANTKPWQVSVAEIPNFPVFWTLAKELHTQAQQR